MQINGRLMMISNFTTHVNFRFSILQVVKKHFAFTYFLFLSLTLWRTETAML